MNSGSYIPVAEERRHLLNTFVQWYDNNFEMEDMPMLTSLIQKTPECVPSESGIASVFQCEETSEILEVYMQLEKNHLLQFRPLPFGLGSASRVFAKLETKSTLLRLEGIIDSMDRDDIIVLNQYNLEKGQAL